MSRMKIFRANAKRIYTYLYIYVSSSKGRRFIRDAVHTLLYPTSGTKDFAGLKKNLHAKEERKIQRERGKIRRKRERMRRKKMIRARSLWPSESEASSTRIPFLPPTFFPQPRNISIRETQIQHMAPSRGQETARSFLRHLLSKVLVTGRNRNFLAPRVKRKKKEEKKTIYLKIYEEREESKKKKKEMKTIERPCSLAIAFFLFFIFLYDVDT